MTFMLCRNRVADYSKWKAVFDSHTQAHQKAGLQLVDMWCEVGDPNSVFFKFAVDSLERAQQFIDSPQSAQAGAESGVLDGEYHFVEQAPGR